MKRLFSFALLLVLITNLLPFPVWAAQESLGASAETVRSQLAAAQLKLTSDPTAAQSALTNARQSYETVLAPILAKSTAAIAVQIAAEFDQAQQALTSVDPLQFAIARSRIWTTVLRGSQVSIEQALQTSDTTSAVAWADVREFRQATRFSRPNADSTLALMALQANSLSSEYAQLAMRADLFDTYQARLTESLRSALDAETKNFTTRRAELVTLAQGYFVILHPAFAEQRGASAATDLELRFAALVDMAAQKQPVASTINELLATLADFRAAPLSPNDQAWRAGQLLRFLNLVQVEYGRGVVNGAIKSDLEIREAITFFEGAQVALDDLLGLLKERDPAQSSQVAANFAQLETQLELANAHSQVAAPSEIKQLVESSLAILQAIMPAEWLKRDNNADFDVIDTALDNMEAAIASGDYKLADSARLEAYALLESGPEARIQAFAGRYKVPIEELFWFGQGDALGLAYLIDQQAPLSTIKASRKALDQLLGEAQRAIAGAGSPTATATNAAIIVFREGLEAVLILASLMGSMKAATSRRLRKPMWWGTIAAVLASALTWLLAQSVLSSLARYGEKLEAVVSLIAIAVLLLITNWFFHQTYWTDHMANLHTKKRSVVGGAAGQWLGLAMLGFTSVYREGFETVLFLQALVLESGAWIVLLGVIIGLAATSLIGLILFRLQVRLPYKKMLIVTGIFIGVVLLTIVGNTTHIMQVVGWLPLHPIRWLTLPYWLGMWFGVYASWEGIVLQLIAAVFVIGSYFLSEALQKQAHRQRQKPGSSALPTTMSTKGVAQ